MAPFSTCAPANRPSGSPLPFVFAVQTMVKPFSGLTQVLIFLMKTGLPSSAAWRHMILGVP